MTPEEFARDCMLEDLHNTMASFGKVIPKDHRMGEIFQVYDDGRPVLKILYDPKAKHPVRFFRDNILTDETLAMKMYFGPEFREHHEAYRTFYDESGF